MPVHATRKHITLSAQRVNSIAAHVSLASNAAPATRPVLLHPWFRSAIRGPCSAIYPWFRSAIRGSTLSSVGPLCHPWAHCREWGMRNAGQGNGRQGNAESPIDLPLPQSLCVHTPYSCSSWPRFCSTCGSQTSARKPEALIHFVDQRLACEIALQVLAEKLGSVVEAAARLSSDVGSDDDVGQVPQG